MRITAGNTLGGKSVIEVRRISLKRKGKLLNPCSTQACILLKHTIYIPHYQCRFHVTQSILVDKTILHRTSMPLFLSFTQLLCTLINMCVCLI